MKTETIFKALSMTISEMVELLDVNEIESMTRGEKVVIAVSVAQSESNEEVIRKDIASIYVKGAKALKDTFLKNAKLAESNKSLMLELQIIQAELEVSA